MSFVVAHKQLKVVRVEGEITRSCVSVNNLHNYSIPEEKAEALWEMEVERLVCGVNDSNSDLLFPETWFDSCDYTMLASFAGDLTSLTTICSVDNEIIARQHLPDMHHTAMFNHLRDHLRWRITMAKDSAPDAQRHDPRTETHRRRFLFSLIDYVTLVLARIIVYSAPKQEAWVYICIACLAKYASKLKVLLRDKVLYSGKSLDAADDVAGSSSGFSDDDDPDADYDEEQRIYYRLNLIAEFHISGFMCCAIHGLTGPGLRPSKTGFEICSVVYETGLEGLRTWVYQERDGDLQASSCQKSLTMAGPAFELVQRTLEALLARQQQRAAQGLPPSDHLRTHVHWNDILGGNGNDSFLKGRELQIHTLGEAVTAMVSLLSVSPEVVQRFPGFLHAITVTRSFRDQELRHNVPPLPASLGKFKAFFNIFTDDNATINDSIAREDSSLSSLRLLARERLLRGPAIAEIHGRTMPPADGTPTRGQRDSVPKARARANDEMKKWIFDENAVFVNCKVYVSLTMVLSVLLASMGVIVGFTVEDSIEAVDPFNITTYCWVLAAFCVLVAKSVRVETWPWHDFLHGRVRCQSVSELHAVTGIAESLIFCKLLEDEGTMILKTRGPYNALFSRKNEGGFFIDRPLPMWTMLLSGLLMVKVSTNQGPALACLDVRRGTTYATVGHVGKAQEQEEEGVLFVCDDLSRPDSLLALKRKAIDWRGIVGLYTERTAAFV